jgi:hypothetical protein
MGFLVDKVGRGRPFSHYFGLPRHILIYSSVTDDIFLILAIEIVVE